MNGLRRWLGQVRQAGHASPTSRDRLAQYNTYDARNLFSHLLSRVATGEEIVIARAGHPVARLVPYARHLETRPGIVRAQIVLNETDEGRV